MFLPNEFFSSVVFCGQLRGCLELVEWSKPGRPPSPDTCGGLSAGQNHGAGGEQEMITRNGVGQMEKTMKTFFLVGSM